MDAYQGTRMESVVCPKPRRAGVSDDPVARPSRFSYSQHGGDGIDFAAGAELLDMILSKGGYGGERFGAPVASSPPYFCGSPPCRVSNPVIQDAHFGTEHLTPLSPAAMSPIWSSSPLISSSVHKSGGGGGERGGGPVRMKFGHKAPAMRVEGFDCLSRDGRHCSISALA
ncbi:hypothetical protein MLD38_021781 [Melastoma candidum]|uniref:Uncharacterized protein n=1 Tax=Melastoma candidum TaxID=119954 RepID=A0ACB9QH74_9MYRT|nr:hypothetical protein MLD38_021781 [Melastoma candidum]